MEQIILYSSSECVRCRLVKQLLDTHRVQYTEIKDDKQLMLDKGFTEAPGVEVDGKIIDTYTSVLGWISRNGWYSFEEVNEDD